MLEGNAVEAMSEAQRQLDADTTNYLTWSMAATMAMEADSFATAGKHFEVLNRIAPVYWDFWVTTYRTSYAYVLSRLGQTARSRAVLDSTLQDARRLLREGDQRPGVRREIAAIYVAYGNRDSALAWLNEAIEHGWRHEAIQPSPWIRQVREQPGFKELLDQMHADIDRMRERIRREKTEPSLSQQ